MARYLIGAVIALGLDFATVVGCLALGVPGALARIFGLLVGITTTYFFNRAFTFSARARASVSEWARYAATQSVGSLLNFAVSTVGLYLGGDSAWHVAAAIAAGAAVGFSYNFFAARRVLQRRQK